jgi:hypothetical protein
MAGFRSSIYARMEEMSFRSGAVAALSVLAAAGLVIALVVTLGGHGAAARATGAGTAVRSAARPSPLASAPATVTASPSPRATAKAKRSVAPQAYEAPVQRTVATTPQAPARQAPALPAAAYPQPHRVKRPTLPRPASSFPFGWFLGWTPGRLSAPSGYAAAAACGAAGRAGCQRVPCEQTQSSKVEQSLGTRGQPIGIIVRKLTAHRLQTVSFPGPGHALAAAG